MEPEFFNNFLKGKDNDFSAGYETGCPFLFLPPLNSLFSDFKPITGKLIDDSNLPQPKSLLYQGCQIRSW